VQDLQDARLSIYKQLCAQHTSCTAPGMWAFSWGRKLSLLLLLLLLLLEQNCHA
jgi:hypothetical protein